MLKTVTIASKAHKKERTVFSFFLLSTLQNHNHILNKTCCIGIYYHFKQRLSRVKFDFFKKYGWRFKVQELNHFAKIGGRNSPTYF